MRWEEATATEQVLAVERGKQGERKAERERELGWKRRGRQGEREKREGEVYDKTSLKQSWLKKTFRRKS